MLLMRWISQNIILLQSEHTHKTFLLLSHVLNTTRDEVYVRKDGIKPFSMITPRQVPCLRKKITPSWSKIFFASPQDCPSIIRLNTLKRSVWPLQGGFIWPLTLQYSIFLLNYSIGAVQVVYWLISKSSLAHLSATTRSGSCSPGIVAQPCFIT